jgi:ElaB/YqjD/DUF883 family membrane-anchored ribosome-binding protein
MLLAQKSMARLQVLLDPALVDVVNSEDRYNILVDWLEKDGVKDPNQFVTSPEEIAKNKTAEAQKQLQDMQGQMAGMQKESQDMMAMSQSAKREAEKSKASAKEADQYTEQVDTGIVKKIGQTIGQDLAGQPEGVESAQAI